LYLRLVFFIDFLFIQTGTDPYAWPPFPSFLPHFLILQVPRYRSTTVVLSVVRGRLTVKLMKLQGPSLA